tara:strand:- start:569 stop:805 length:237 start_codon:yes stop_codon:yes gene_type:complete
MKARNLIPQLNKAMGTETEVTVALDGKEYEIVSVSNSAGKKIIAVQVITEDMVVEDDNDIDVVDIEEVEAPKKKSKKK